MLHELSRAVFNIFIFLLLPEDTYREHSHGNAYLSKMEREGLDKVNFVSPCRYIV